MQTFARMCEAVGGVGKRARVEPDVLTVEIDGQYVELKRLRVGDEEWVAISVMIGDAAPSWHAGLGAIVRCRSGWALRIVLPVGEVSPRTVREVMQRLAHEGIAIRRGLRGSVDDAVVWMWTD